MVNLIRGIGEQNDVSEDRGDGHKLEHVDPASDVVGLLDSGSLQKFLKLEQIRTSLKVDEDHGNKGGKGESS